MDKQQYAFEAHRQLNIITIIKKLPPRSTQRVIQDVLYYSISVPLEIHHSKTLHLSMRSKQTTPPLILPFAQNPQSSSNVDGPCQVTTRPTNRF